MKHEGEEYKETEREEEEEEEGRVTKLERKLQSENEHIER